MKKKILSLLFVLATSIGTLFAYTKIGDLYFELAIPDDGAITAARVVYHSSYSELTSVTIPHIVEWDNTTWLVTRIGERAFANCTKLQNVTFNAGNRVIENEAFKGCTGLTTLSMSSSITDIQNGAFDGCVNLTSVTIPEGVVVIGPYAFRDCTSLLSVAIPESVKGIYHNAFENVCNIEEYHGESSMYFPFGARCGMGYVDGLFVFATSAKTSICACSSAATGNITIPNSVENIQTRAFKGCNKITNITIPNSVKGIWKDAFYGCTGLTKIDIPNSVTEIRSGAFGKCTGLTSITLPNSVTSIGDSAFISCDNLSTLVLHDGIKNIGSKLLYNCKKITSLAIPESVTSIGSYAFSGTGINSISIPDNVSGIGDYAFANCANLKNIRIGNKVSQMNTNVFHNSYNIIDVYWDIPSFNSFDFSHAKLKSITFGSAVTRIPDGICKDQSNLSKVEFLSDKITEIGANAFNGCKSLSYIQHFPEALQKIKENAFKNAPLISITIPVNVDEIGANAFTGCNPKIVYWNADGSKLDPQYIDFGNRLEEVYLGDNVKIIHDYLFKNQTKITELYIPSGYISMGAFWGCTGLRKLRFGAGISKFDRTAFKECVNIEGALVLPDALDTIPTGAFDNCTKITSVTIGKNVKKISGFKGCTGIKTVYNFSSSSLVPHAGGVDEPEYYADKVYNNMELQGEYLFSGTSLIGYMGQAIDITLPADYKGSTYRIGEQAFMSSAQLSSVTLPESVVAIGKSSFDGCTGLSSVAIPNSVTKIEEKAFNGCSNISTISFGANLTQLGANALAGCTSINEVNCSAVNPPTANANTFSNVPTSATLNVPAGSRTAYKNAQGWSQFANIVETNLVNTTGVTLSTTTLNLKKGGEAVLYATVTPSNASYKTVTWSTSNSSVAEVTNGIVYGKSAGTATITCTTTNGGYSATCEVTVSTNAIKATGMEFYKYAAKAAEVYVPYSKMNEGDTLKFVELATGFIDANVMPYSVSNGNIDFVNSDPHVVSAELTSHINFTNSIKLTPRCPGIAKLTISTTDGTNISMSVYVQITPDPNVKVIGVRCLPKEITIGKGEKDTIEALVLPFDATNADVFWSKTSEGNPLSVNIKSLGLGVNRCEISAKSVGTAYVYVETNDGKYKDTCKITIINKVPVTGLSLNQTSKTLNVGETFQLTPVFTPSNATNQNVYWMMDNDSVATIENGLVTAIQEGAVTITCVSEDGNYEATCAITVTNEEPPVVEPITVRLKASSATGWSKVNLYYWADGITSPAWPGITINKDADGWYSHTFDASVASVNIIWNDGNNQTVDIMGVTESTCYSLNSTFGKTISVTIVECQAAATVSVTGVSLNKKTLQMVIGNTATVTASVLPANASNKSVTWTSSNTATATVSSTGTISAKADGVTTITCKTVDGNFTAECYVVVSEANSEYTFSYEPTNATVINYTATKLSYNEIPENNCVFAALADNAHTLNLMYVGSLVNGVIPQGNYKISSTLQKGTFCYSIGGDDLYDYGSFLATDYDNEGRYSTPYYIIAGDITIGSSNNYIVKVISANGTDINVTYNDTQDIEIVHSEIKASKILRNGQIFILRGEKVYTVTGLEVQ